MSSTPLLELNDLHTRFRTREGTGPAVDHLSFSIEQGETVALIGESGCGKSVTGLSIMRLLPDPPGRIVGGSIRFMGRDLLTLSEREMRSVRGSDISMIFQEPMTSLNPLHTIGAQIVEAILLHERVTRNKARDRAVELLTLVGLPDPALQMNEYPHRLSGGMRQRVMIAMAIACRPKLIIADEPTTALDVTVQAQILQLLRKLQREFGMSILLITHDFGVVAEMAERVVVMYSGRKVEDGPVERIFRSPAHPYTQGLLRARPMLQRDARGWRETELYEINGVVPSLFDLPPGCRFAPRCQKAATRCVTEVPRAEAIAGGGSAACFFADGQERPKAPSFPERSEVSR